ncbi:MAG: hypothetical protein C0175_02695, partial [Caldisericum exile]
MDEIDTAILELTKQNEAYLRENMQLHDENVRLHKVIEQEKINSDKKISELLKQMQLKETKCKQTEQEYARTIAELTKKIEDTDNRVDYMKTKISRIIEDAERDYERVILARSGNKIHKEALSKIKEVI